jgi:hypothetical protein
MHTSEHIFFSMKDMACHPLTQLIVSFNNFHNHLPVQIGRQEGELAIILILFAGMNFIPTILTG